MRDPLKLQIYPFRLISVKSLLGMFRPPLIGWLRKIHADPLFLFLFIIFFMLFQRGSSILIHIIVRVNYCIEQYYLTLGQDLTALSHID